VDLVHQATFGTITAQTGLQIITGGSTGFTFTVANTVATGGATWPLGFLRKQYDG